MVIYSYIEIQKQLISNIYIRLLWCCIAFLPASLGIISLVDAWIILWLPSFSTLVIGCFCLARGLHSSADNGHYPLVPDIPTDWATCLDAFNVEASKRLHGSWCMQSICESSITSEASFSVGYNGCTFLSCWNRPSYPAIETASPVLDIAWCGFLEARSPWLPLTLMYFSLLGRLVRCHNCRHRFLTHCRFKSNFQLCLCSLYHKWGVIRITERRLDVDVDSCFNSRFAYWR